MRIVYFKGKCGVLFPSFSPDMIMGLPVPISVELNEVEFTTETKYSATVHMFKDEPLPGIYEGSLGLFFRNYEDSSKYLGLFLRKSCHLNPFYHYIFYEHNKVFLPLSRMILYDEFTPPLKVVFNNAVVLYLK